MAAITPPWAIQASSHPADRVRQSLAGSFGSPTGLFAGGIQSTAAGGSHGVINSGDLAVTQNGSPNMSVNVAIGFCVIHGTENAAQGCYGPCLNDATLNVVIAASDPTNPRKDLIVAKIRDQAYSGGSNDFSIVAVTGTPAGAPVDPAVPANGLVIARVNVAAAAVSIVNANITDLRTRSAALGGVLVCTSTTRPSGASLYPGLTIFETDTFKLMEYTTGTTLWQPPWNLPWGVLSRVSGWNASADQGGFNATPASIVGPSTTLTAVANRLYRLDITFWAQQLTATGNWRFTFLRDAGVIGQFGYWDGLVANAEQAVVGFMFDTTTSASHTWTVQATTSAGTLTVKNATVVAHWSVSDCGPTANPA